MRTFACASLLVLAACGGNAVAAAPMTPCETTAAPAPAPATRADKPRSPELDKLAERRMAAMKEWIDLLRARYERGSISVVDYLGAKRELALAARDSLRGEPLKKALEAYVDDAKKLMELTRARHPAAAGDDDLKLAEVRIAEAEYWLAEAKSRE